jgi:hypothetical protein
MARTKQDARKSTGGQGAGAGGGEGASTSAALAHAYDQAGTSPAVPILSGT